MSISVETASTGSISRRQVADLAAAVQRADGAPPLSDQALTRVGSSDGVDLAARDGADLAGYARLDGASLEIVGRRDVLDELLAAAAQVGPADLHVWSHGRRSRLVPVLEAAGFARSRELHQLRRALDPAHLPGEPVLADGVAVRAFEPGRDDAAWLALNAAAFAHHPEQGGWTQRDLDARTGEAWFAAADFLLAERAGHLVGFHWTKVHPDGNGEVYVLGVAPSAQGLGLGGALLTLGLRHLAGRGCPLVLLYVDGDNPTALRLYERNGFARYDLDVQWRAPSPA